MNRTDEYRKDALKRIELHERQRDMKKRRENEKKKKDDIGRYIIIGRLVCQYFPDMMKYRPQHNDAENAEEFSELEAALAFVAEHEAFVEAVKKQDTEGTV